MGRERSGTGKQICLCIALLMCFGPWACSLGRMLSPEVADTTGQEAGAHLALGRTYLARGEYGKALYENGKAASLAGKDVPVDEALFNIGLIHAHPANPARNYEKSELSFRRLIKDHPGSPMAEQAKIVMGLLREIAGLLQEKDKLGRTTDHLNQVIDEQKKTVDKLNSLIDELKNVDIDVEQKKRKKAN